MIRQCGLEGAQCYYQRKLCDSHLAQAFLSPRHSSRSLSLTLAASFKIYNCPYCTEAFWFSQSKGENITHPENLVICLSDPRLSLISGPFITAIAGACNSGLISIF
jgi:hypothetical protein